MIVGEIESDLYKIIICMWNGKKSNKVILFII